MRQDKGTALRAFQTEETGRAVTEVPRVRLNTGTSFKQFGVAG
jgi:hypothetical protein